MCVCVRARARMRTLGDDVLDVLLLVTVENVLHLG